MRKATRKSGQSWYMAAVFGLLLAAGLSAAGEERVYAEMLDIVRDGTSDFVICGNAADPAVLDLQRCLRVMSGVELTIVPVHDPLPQRAIVVGRHAVDGYTPPDISPQGYHLKVQGSRLLIYAIGDETAHALATDARAVRELKVSPRGAQFGVYGLLCDLLGCRFLTKDVEFVPRRATVSVPSDLDLVCEPAVRDRLPGGPTPASVDDSAWRRQNRMGWLIGGHANHVNYTRWISPKDHLVVHPDWFPLTASGTREAQRDWYCWSNASFLAALESLLRERLPAIPTDQYVDFGQGDGPVACHCAGCKELVDRYGSNSAPCIWGLNTVIKALAQDFPNHHFTTFAYDTTDEPPIRGDERLAPHPRLNITYVRRGDHLKAMPAVKRLREQFAGWRSLTDNITVWTWGINFNCPIAPLPNYRAMLDDAIWFAPQVRGFMFQLVAGGDFQELREWTYAQVLWDDSLNPADLQREFLRLYYGPGAATYLWRYLQRVQARGAATSEPFNAVFTGGNARIKEVLYPPDALTEDRRDFEAALAAAAEDDPAYAARVRDTYARSLALFRFEPPAPLAFVVDAGQQWLLPNGDASLGGAAEWLAEALWTAKYQEMGGTFWGRRVFLDLAGGRVGPVLDNGRIRVSVCPALDGAVVSVLDKKSGRELLSIGPPPEGRLSGLHHAIMTRWGADDWAFSTGREDGCSVARGRGRAVNNAWYLGPKEGTLLHEKTIRVQDGERRFVVESSLRVNPASAWMFRTSYQNFKLDEPFYDGRVTIRLAASEPEQMAVEVTGETLYFRHAFADAPACRIPLSRTGASELNIRVLSGPEHPSVVLGLNTEDWQTVECRYLPDRREMLLHLQGIKRTASLDAPVSMGRIEFSVEDARPLGQVHRDARAPAYGTGPVRVAMDGSGDFQSLGDAFGALPEAPWTADMRIELADCSGGFSGGYAGARIRERVIRAAGEHRLIIRGVGGQPVVSGTLDFNGQARPSDARAQRLSVVIENLCFQRIPTGRTAENPMSALEGIGPGSRIVGNRFLRGFVPAIALQNYATHSGVIIERNVFRGGGVSDGGAAQGGNADAPCVIRNNVFLDCNGDAMHLCKPKHVWFLNNLCVNVRVRVDAEPLFTVANNLFTRGGAMRLVAEPEAYSERPPRVLNNLFWQAPQPPGWVMEEGAGNRVGDPGWRQAEASDDFPFHMSDDGLLVDAGVEGPVGNVDFYGHPRVRGKGVDIGPVESGQERSSQ